MERPPKPRFTSKTNMTQWYDYADYLERELTYAKWDLDNESNWPGEQFRQFIYIDGWQTKIAKIRNKYIDAKLNKPYGRYESNRLEYQKVIESCISKRLTFNFNNDEYCIDCKSTYTSQNSTTIILPICTKPFIYRHYNKIDVLERFYYKVYLADRNITDSIRHYSMSNIYDDYYGNNYDFFKIGDKQRFVLDLFTDMIFDFIKNLQGQLLNKHLKSIRNNNIMPMIIKLMETKWKN